MKINKILQVLEVLHSLANEDRTKNTWLSGTVRFKLAGNIFKAKSIYSAYEERRLELVRKFGSPVEGKPGEMAVTDPDSLKKFNEALSPLLDEDHDLVLDKISKKDLLGKSGDNQFSVGLIEGLMDLGVLSK